MAKPETDEREAQRVEELSAHGGTHARESKKSDLNQAKKDELKDGAASNSEAKEETADTTK